MNTLLLIDANGLLHRAYHALPPLRTSSGEMVQSVYGTLAILFRVLKEHSPTHAVAVFDMAAPTFRHRAYKEYKATRAKAPDELYQQIPRVKEALGALGILVAEREGFEADDIIGTLAKTASREKEWSVLILSGDLDCLQLVGNRVTVLVPGKGIREMKAYGVKEVKERFGGLLPSQMTDYKGLRGDPSDNLPGAKGIGEKTAIALLRDFGDIDAIYRGIQNEESGEFSPRVLSALLQSRDDVTISREMAKIDTDVPLAMRLEEASWSPPDLASLEKFLNRFEFASLLPRAADIAAAGSSAPARENSEEDAAEKIDRLLKEGVLSDFLGRVERDLVPVVRAMEREGIKINKRAFLSFAKELKKELAAREEKITDLAGEKFNVNSPKQLSRILFGALELPAKGLKKTPGGVVSTASSELEKLEDLHPIVRDVLAYRETAKLLNTYVEPLPELADERGRIHTTFDQLGTATGRLSSSSPNLQNIPVQGHWGKRIRSGFVPERPNSFVSFDYSQMELRVAAALSQDKRMLEIFALGEDIHRSTASEVFNITPDLVSDQQRSQAKALNFGLLYGMGIQGFGRSAGISTKEASAFVEAYEKRFPGIQRYIRETKEFARERGYTETFFGRRRFVPEIRSSNPRLRAAAERAAVNFPVQGTSADIVKIAMVEISRLLAGKPSWKMVLQVHDELLFEAPDGSIKETAPKIQSVMENVARGGLTLKVDVAAGPDWGNLVPLHNTHNA